MWSKGAGKEVNCVIPKGSSSSSMVLPITTISEILTKKLNFFSVERIKEEEIFAGKIVGAEIIIQLHVKRTPIKVQIKVLCKNEVLTQLIVKKIPLFIVNS